MPTNLDHATYVMPRAPRGGRVDGSSVKGNYVVRWLDEDSGWHQAGVYAESEEQAIQALAHLVDTSVARAYLV